MSWNFQDLWLHEVFCGDKLEIMQEILFNWIFKKICSSVNAEKCRYIKFCNLYNAINKIYLCNYLFLYYV